MALKCECGGEIRRTIDNKDECIICENSKKGGDKMAKIPEQTYAEIAEPFGKQFRDAIREAYARGYADGNKRAKLDVKMDGKRIGDMMREETPQEKVCDVQRQRDRIIKQAKKDIENMFIEGNHGVGKVVDTKFGHCTVEFVVNREKRTVVALLRGAYAKEIFGKGIAKCVPGDCFNIHIGKIVGLRKALGKSIDDYMNVPNPTEVRVGDIARYPNGRIVEIINRDNDRIRVRTVETGEINIAISLAKVEIIDDSREDKE